MSIENMKLWDTRAVVSKFITHEGKTLSVIDWCKVIGKGLTPNTIYKRMKRTDDPVKLLRTDNLTGLNKETFDGVHIKYNKDKRTK